MPGFQWMGFNYIETLFCSTSDIKQYFFDKETLINIVDKSDETANLQHLPKICSGMQ